jgi:spore coat polysaccharide biosynthesis protein SpsF
MKTVAIIQARMSASRLPGKVLLEINGRPMLEWVVNRTCRARGLDDVVVATTKSPSDDPVSEFCKHCGYKVVRGSVHDVLDRYYQAALHFQAEVIVRITADCPLIDPGLIDATLKIFQSGIDRQNSISKSPSQRFDFIANRLPPPWGRTYPIGLDIEIFTFDSLEQAHRMATLKNQREHVTPYFYEGTPAECLRYQKRHSPFSSTISPNGHNIALVHHTPDYGHLRWTVDTPEDLELVRSIVSHFSSDSFTWQEVLDLVLKKPELSQINAQVQHKSHLDVDDRNPDGRRH